MKTKETASTFATPSHWTHKTAIFSPTICLIAFMSSMAMGQTTRNWTGANSANWSDPNNWSPAGLPASGDTLQFGEVSDSNHTMENDLSGVQVTNLLFAHNSYTLNGNAITTAEIYNSADDYSDNGSFTTTINCPLVFAGYGGQIFSEAPNGTLTQSTLTLHLNGPITIGSGGLGITADAYADNESVGGGNSHIFLSGPISGNGSVGATANTDPFELNSSSIQFDGTEGNTFTGTLYPGAAAGALIIFNKSSGFVVTNGLAIDGGYIADVQLAGANQIGNNANLIFYEGGHLALSGNYNITVGSIVFSNLYEEGTFDCTLDTGSLTVGLNAGIFAASYNPDTMPTIKGKINFNGLLPVEVDGSSTPGLEIQAVIEGAGFNKTGNGSLQLDASNTFYGNLEISAGYVIPTNTAALSPSASAGVILNGGNLLLSNLVINTDPLFVNSSNSTLITHGTCSWSGPVTLNQTLNLIPVDDTLAGLVTTFSGAITGSGGMTLEDVFLAAGNVEFSGSSANSFSGPLSVQCKNLNLDKPAHTGAYGGPLIVGSGPGPVCQVSWENHYQGLNEGEVTLYTNGIVDLNGYNDNFGPVTYNGGIIETFAGNLSLFGTVTVNPAGQIAYLSGNITLPPGNPVEFSVPQGYTVASLELSCQATFSGSAPSLIKQGSGTMSLAGTNSSLASTLVQQGIVDVDNASALGTTPVVVSNGATLKFDQNNTLSQSFEISGDGVSGLGAIICEANSFVTLNGNVLLDAETTLNPASSNSLITLGGVVYGTGPLTDIGAGYLYFTGNSANTFSGTTFADQGTVELSKSAGVIAVPGNLVIGTKSSPFNNNGTTATVLQNQSGGIGGTNVTVNGGSSYLMEGHNQSLANVNLNNGGSIQTDFGTLTLTGGNAANVVSVSPGQTGASIINGYVNLASGGIFSVGARPTGGTTPELDMQAGLSDQIASGITKSGAGQMQLSAANSFSSPMTINGGKLTLAVSGALGNSTSTTVNSNGTLVVENDIAVQNNLLTLNSFAQPAWQSLSGSNIWSAGVLLNQTAAIQVLPAGGYLNLRGAISGNGGLTTIGAGTLQFQGTNANTYSGLTTVTAGVVEAGRSNTIVHHNIMGQLVTNEVPVFSIPGDTVIGSDVIGSPTAVLRSLREQQFASGVGANVAVHLSGLLDVAYQSGQTDAPKEYVQTLTGAGQVNIGSNCSLTTYNTTPFVFSGTINGAGTLILDGPGTVTTWGDINNTGPVYLYNGDWELFGARHNGGITVESGRLAGDGTVDGAVVLYGSLGVGSHLPNPQAGVFHLGSLLAYAGDTVQLSMFGPSPLGGNDQIATTSGGVTLDPSGGTILQTSFNYPPRAGDVIDLVSVPAGQTISGTFSNFAEGVVTLVGQIPVLPSYHGGTGHDFTLTVTNLALAYVGYELAEGNGNQTVEPDECNLLYVSLVNRRTGSLIITNAYLRATNETGVLVTVPTAVFPTISAGQTMTNTTPFQFSTDTNLPCGGAVGFELVVGVMNEGQFAVDFSPVSGTDCSHPTGPCDSCTVASGLFTTNAPTTTSPIYFVGSPSIAFPPKAYPGLDPSTNLPPFAYLTHNFTNASTNAAIVTAQLEYSCASAPTNALGVVAYVGEFDPTNPGTNYLGDSGGGGQPYSPFMFQVPAATNFTLVVMARATNLVCENYTLQLFGLPCPLPTLAITNDTTPQRLRVQWSTAYPGFIAQQTGNLGGAFSNVIQAPAILNGRYALTNISAISNEFYRLKK